MSLPTSPALLRAYCLTRYQIPAQRGCPPLELRAGKRNPALDRFLAAKGRDCAIFLTADNPGSRRSDAWRNPRRRATLSQRLHAMGKPVYRGVGRGPDTQAWPAESSLLILGIETEAGLQLARDFGQLALLFHRRGDRSLLLFAEEE